jgi:hypothetical protein
MNQLKVNQQQTIVSLHEQGWSKRKEIFPKVVDGGGSKGILRVNQFS